MNRVVERGAREAGISVIALCNRVQMSRQNYYAARRLRQHRKVDEALILELVRRERRLQPRLGGRKLLRMLQPDMQEAGVEVGRDRFFETTDQEENIGIGQRQSRLGYLGPPCLAQRRLGQIEQHAEIVVPANKRDIPGVFRLLVGLSGHAQSLD